MKKRNLVSEEGNKDLKSNFSKGMREVSSEKRVSRSIFEMSYNVENSVLLLSSQKTVSTGVVLNISASLQLAQLLPIQYPSELDLNHKREQNTTVLSSSILSNDKYFALLNRQK
jgi:hypothetical protein